MRARTISKEPPPALLPPHALAASNASDRPNPRDAPVMMTSRRIAPSASIDWMG